MQGLHTRALSRQLLFSNLSFSHLSEMLFCRHMKTMHPDEVTDARSAVEATAVTPNVAAGDVLLFDSWAIYRVRTAFAQDSLRTAVRTAFAQPCAQTCTQPSHSTGFADAGGAPPSFSRSVFEYRRGELRLAVPWLGQEVD